MFLRILQRLSFALILALAFSVKVKAQSLDEIFIKENSTLVMSSGHVMAYGYQDLYQKLLEEVIGDAQHVSDIYLFIQTYGEHVKKVSVKDLTQSFLAAFFKSDFKQEERKILAEKLSEINLYLKKKKKSSFYVLEQLLLLYDLNANLDRPSRLLELVSLNEWNKFFKQKLIDEYSLRKVALDVNRLREDMSLSEWKEYLVDFKQREKQYIRFWGKKSETLIKYLALAVAESKDLDINDVVSFKNLLRSLYRNMRISTAADRISSPSIDGKLYWYSFAGIYDRNMLKLGAFLKDETAKEVAQTILDYHERYPKSFSSNSEKDRDVRENIKAAKEALKYFN